MSTDSTEDPFPLNSDQFAEKAHAILYWCARFVPYWDTAITNRWRTCHKRIKLLRQIVLLEVLRPEVGGTEVPGIAGALGPEEWNDWTQNAEISLGVKLQWA